MARKAYRVRINKEEKKIEPSKKNKVWSKQLEFSIISIFFALFVGISAIYAMYDNSIKDEQGIVKVGTLEVNYQSSLDKLELIDSFPVSDEIGLKKSPYSFTITNKGEYDVSYRVRLVDNYTAIGKDGCQKNILSNSMVKVSINNKQPFILKNKENNNYIIAENSISKNEKKDYKVRIWIDKDSKDDAVYKHYHGKIIVNVVSMDTRKIKK